MADPAPVPQALQEALAIRNRRRRQRRQWVILPSAADPIENLAASVNQAKHQRLRDAFRPEGYVAEYL